MDKIKELLAASGCNPELIDNIVESMVSYKETVKEAVEKEYAAKVAAAKKICLEETEAHKRELARRLQVYCETRSVAIESNIARKIAVNESEAQVKLRELKQLLEGIDVGARRQNDAALKNIKNRLKLAMEQKERAVELANRHVSIAEKSLKQNRSLVVENARLKSQISGSVPNKTVAENREVGKTSRIDGARKSRATVTTRSPIVENVEKRSIRTAENRSNVTGRSGGGIEFIAESMDSDLL